jgi:SAM-dependent methyltransferase
MMLGKKTRSSWAGNKVNDWAHYLPPARPSRSELRIVNRHVQELCRARKPLRVAILGSTVEFRSLCHRLGADVTVIEFSREHYRILSRQPMKHRGREELREEDWRGMKVDRKYDLILGDLVLNVVARRDIASVLRNIARSLARDGRCLLRTWVRSNDRRPALRTIVAQHRRRTPGIHFYTACMLPLHMCDYDFEKDNADYAAMIRRLFEACRAGIVREAEYRYCRDRWQWEGSAFTIPRKTVLEQLKRRFFRIATVQYGDDCYRRWAPIYVLKAKR